MQIEVRCFATLSPHTPVNTVWSFTNTRISPQRRPSTILPS